MHSSVLRLLSLLRSDCGLCWRWKLPLYNGHVPLMTRMRSLEFTERLARYCRSLFPLYFLPSFSYLVIDRPLVPHHGTHSLLSLSSYFSVSLSVCRKAVVLDGTCTWKHGVGLGNKCCFVRRWDPLPWRSCRSSRPLWTPNNLMNPGKLL